MKIGFADHLVQKQFKLVGVLFCMLCLYDVTNNQYVYQYLKLIGKTLSVTGYSVPKVSLRADGMPCEWEEDL